MNGYQATVMHATGWFLVLLDGWEMHTHWVAALGFVFLIYSMWRMIVIKEPEDEAFEEIERKQMDAQGWRKRQIATLKTAVESFDGWGHSHRPDQYWVERHAYLAGFEDGARNERMKKEIND